MITKAIAPEAAPPASGAYSPALRVGDWVFVSGQRGISPTTGRLEAGTVHAETQRALLNIAALLQAAGTSVDCIVSVDVCMSDLSLLPELDRAFEEFFDAPLPARSVMQAALQDGAMVQISCVAYCGR
ncbi:MAG: RidA family protein [Fimbriimonadia bacterium]